MVFWNKRLSIIKSVIIKIFISVLFEKLFMLGLRALYGRLERG